METQSEEMDDNNNVQMEELIPRNYQSEMLQAVLDHNSIIYLPTGAGKTFIAFMAMRHYYSLIDRPFGLGGKRIVFAAPKVALVTQQHQVLQRQTQFSVGLFNGNMNVDNWSRDTWHQQFAMHAVLVMGSQILLDVLDKGFLKMSDICLLVLDECHHATEKHNMRLIMENHYRDEVAEMPRILGLTATLVKKNMAPHKLQAALEELERNLHSSIVRHYNDEDLRGLYANPRIRTLPVPGLQGPLADSVAKVVAEVNDQRLLQTIRTLGSSIPKGRTHIPGLGRLVQKKNSAVCECEKALLDISHHLEDLGLFGGKLALMHHANTLKVLRFTVSSNSNERKVLDLVLQHLDKIRAMLELAMSRGKGNYLQMAYFSSQKVCGMFDVVRGGVAAGAALCGIVFVERRVTAVVLYHMIKIAMEVDATLASLKPDFALGGASGLSFGSREYLMNNNKMKKSIDRFNAGVTNLVVSTDVLEEGIDVPRCNVVVRFDQIKTMCSYIQSKGRARDRSATFHVLDLDADFAKKSYTYQQMEQMLKHLQTKGDEGEGDCDESKLAPFETSSGSKATVDNAIRLVYRYCVSLSSGRFGVAEPNWYYTELSEQGPFTFSVVLPVASPLKTPVTGPEMGSMKEAKGACALQTVRVLHAKGELDDNLSPRNKSDHNDLLNDKELFRHWCKSEPGDEQLPAAGTNRRRRDHQITHPECLRGPGPEPNSKLFVHLLLSKAEKCEEDTRKSFLRTLASWNKEGFALISSKPWPELCRFPVFPNFGEVQISVRVNSFTVQLDVSQLQKVRKFHRFVFEKVLNVQHDFLEFGLGDCCNFLVAPFKYQLSAFSLDWELLGSKFDLIEEGGATAAKGDLLGRVVNPTHRPSEHFDPANWNYVVTKVRRDLCPQSPMGGGKSRSFAEHFKSKYNKEITDLKQPLIEVRPISQKLNMLTQGKYNAASRSSEREGELLVPELCVLAPVNAVLDSKMWLAATLLPSVVARCTRLLVADAVRCEINAATRLGTALLPKGAEWEAMRVTEFGDKYCSYKMAAGGTKRLSVRSSSLKPLQTPWEEEDEPMDLEYNLLTATDEDVARYARFASVKLEDTVSLDSIKASYKQRDASIKPRRIELLERRGGGQGVQLGAVYAALACTTANDAVDMERFEVLGDSFLKFAASFFLFATYSDLSEGKLTQIKGKIVGNKNLFYCAMNRKLAGSMSAARFSPRLEWQPLCYSVPEVLRAQFRPEGERHPSELRNVLKTPSGFVFREADSVQDTNMHPLLGVQHISDKCVADCAEALLGVYVESCGPVAAAGVLSWLEILPPQLKHLLTSPIRSAIFQDNLESGLTAAKSIDKHLHRVDRIEEVLSYKFRDRGLLLEALTHSSCMTNRLTNCNQRLEFLGDAVLDLLITCCIYEQCGQLSPGAVTDLRSALVNNVVFGCLAVRFGLHAHLLHNSPNLFGLVDAFVEHQQLNDHAITQEFVLALNEESCMQVATFVEVPKVLGDVWESLAGAVFLDSGNDLAATWRAFQPLMQKEIDAFSRAVPIQPVRMLYEALGKQNCRFEPVEQKGCGGVVLRLRAKLKGGDTLECFGQGRSKQQAKTAAAKFALKTIDASTSHH